ncbi:Oidioi.mRNA.OKI2018_I69.PAR.g11654.t1.cds [Oikopleura dioica]|uniref:Oidioi.mRNA.OKI2018_I69.PAR.g11654.t1.cds n=1 Tax=Oikopleura dioica TaxID=34765 RepID=A0ABN7S2F4_OIKDI|nr:Oidioi.mRNA.OKI2018_I69.PAR.g11654.t1.cds [Oikopleura dioica]
MGGPASQYSYNEFSMRMLHRQYYLYNLEKKNFKYPIEVKFLMEGKSNKWLEEEAGQWGDLIFNAKEKKIISQINKLLDDETFGVVISDLYSFVTWEKDFISQTSHSICRNLTTCGAAGTYIPNLKGCYGEMLDFEPKKETPFLREFGNFTEFAANFVKKSPLKLLPAYFLKDADRRVEAPLLLEPKSCEGEIVVMISTNGERFRRRNLHRSLNSLNEEGKKVSLFFFLSHADQIGRYRHESRALQDIFVGNFSMMGIDNYDQQPNYRYLTGIRFAKENCQNMQTFIFHSDGFFPNYHEISTKTGNTPFMACLGRVEEDSLELRIKQPFTKNWWRFDQLPLDYQIPRYCDNQYGGVMDKLALHQLEKTMSLSEEKVFSFHNGHIFFTGIMRDKAGISLTDMPSRGVDFNDALFLKERSYGDFTEDDVQKTFRKSFGKEVLENELKKIQSKMKEIK